MKAIYDGTGRSSLPCSWSETRADIIERMLGINRTMNIESDEATTHNESVLQQSA